MEDVLWIVFRDPNNKLSHMDKHVVAIVSDANLLAYRHHLAGAHGTVHEIVRATTHLQPFVYVDGLHYCIRKYRPWSTPDPSGTT
jgi:hypothetical protein